MSDETKRLLKCDFRYCMQSAGHSVIAIVGLTIWFWFFLGEIVDLFLLIFLYIGIITFTLSISDWQFRNALYVNMGVKRENVYKAIVCRGIFFNIIIMFMEVIIGALFYHDKVHFNLLLFSLGFFMICHGYGQITGILMYQQSKLGNALQLIGIMALCGVFGFLIVISMEESFPNIAEWINRTHVVIVLVLAAFVWGFGMYRGHKQMKDFAVC